MIKHGADINIKNRQGDNLIMIIIQVHEENEEKAFTLIKALTEASKGALQGLLNDPKEAFNTDGYAVIHLLVEKNLLRILRYLRKNAGLKLNIRVSSIHTPRADGCDRKGETLRLPKRKRGMGGFSKSNVILTILDRKIKIITN